MMGRMPVSFAVSVLNDVSVFMVFDDLFSFVGGEVKPLAVSAWFH
jgi:hypothetical protein